MNKKLSVKCDSRTPNLGLINGIFYITLEHSEKYTILFIFSTESE
jgi:hypothetical protein